MPSREAPIACSLGASDASARRARWQALADAALIEHGRTPEGARQTYRPEPPVERELTALIELEADCCAFLKFRLSRRQSELVLDIHGPEDAAGIIALFASAGRPGTQPRRA